jgi:hypothetical protein
MLPYHGHSAHHGRLWLAYPTAALDNWSVQTSRVLKAASGLLLITLTAVTESHAGMPSFTLRDIYRVRFQELSFFIFLLLFCAFLFQLMWNYAIKGFRSLPRLNFWRSLCLASLFGLLMLLVLTMISGIREVLTPGAWRKQGSTYRLNDSAQEPVRKRSLEHLRTALFNYAQAHQGTFPPHDFAQEIPEKLWESPDPTGSHYVYSGGLSTNGPGSVLALEPPNFGENRFVLLISGEIRLLSKEEIETRLKRGAVE